AACQQRDAIVGTGDRQIRYAVAVEVNHSHAGRNGAGREAHCALEAPITITQEFADRAQTTGDHNVKLAIAVKVTRLNVKRAAGWKIAGESKRAIAVI